MRPVIAHGKLTADARAAVVTRLHEQFSTSDGRVAVIGDLEAQDVDAVAAELSSGAC